MILALIAAVFAAAVSSIGSDGAGERVLVVVGSLTTLSILALPRAWRQVMAPMIAAAAAANLIVWLFEAARMLNESAQIVLAAIQVSVLAAGSFWAISRRQRSPGQGSSLYVWRVAYLGLGTAIASVAIGLAALTSPGGLAYRNAAPVVGLVAVGVCALPLWSHQWNGLRPRVSILAGAIAIAAFVAYRLAYEVRPLDMAAIGVNALTLAAVIVALGHKPNGVPDGFARGQEGRLLVSWSVRYSVAWTVLLVLLIWYWNVSS